MNTSDILSNTFMILGFVLSLYSCVSNDIIQTLGTFLSSTREKPVWMIWLFTSLVLVLTLGIGWYLNGGDMAFGRLDRIPFAEHFYWWHILPPIVLIALTKKGIPVGTAFLILSLFSSTTVTGLIILNSLKGYILAFISSFILYFFISRSIEKYFLYTNHKKVPLPWVIVKWVSTAVLWSAWLMQDGSKVYVYLPRHLTFAQMALTLIAFCALLLVICYTRGGEIQNIIKLKTNTQDIRSAAIIDFVYASILVYFQLASNIPISTTWVFIGVLAGREVAMYNRIRFETDKKVVKHVIKDLTKTTIGLVVSMAIVVFIKNMDLIFGIIHQYIHL